MLFFIVDRRLHYSVLSSGFIDLFRCLSDLLRQQVHAPPQGVHLRPLPLLVPVLQEPEGTRQDARGTPPLALHLLQRALRRPSPAAFAPDAPPGGAALQVPLLRDGPAARRKDNQGHTGQVLKEIVILRLGVHIYIPYNLGAPSCSQDQESRVSFPNTIASTVLDHNR